MPLPFILAGLAVAAVGTGAKKAYDGYQDSSRADDIISSAERRQRKAKEEYEEYKERYEYEITDLGKLRLDISIEIKSFKDIVEKLIEILKEKENGEIKFSLNFPVLANFSRINQFTETAFKVTNGAFSGAAAGIVAGYAVYGGVMTLAAASTGTAISTLSGVAATNAALAAIGGGSLAAGGLGIAGGTAILGGVVAAPIIALAAWKYASSAEEKLDKARKFRDEIDDEIIPKLNQTNKKLDQLRSDLIYLYCRTNEFRSIFKEYHFVLSEMLRRLKTRKNPNEQLLKSTEQNLAILMSNGMSIANILTDMCTISPFKMKNNKPEIGYMDLPISNVESAKSLVGKFNKKISTEGLNKKREEMTI